MRRLRTVLLQDLAVLQPRYPSLPFFVTKWGGCIHPGNTAPDEMAGLHTPWKHSVCAEPHVSYIIWASPTAE